MSIFVKQERTLFVIGFFTEENSTNRYFAFIGFNQELPAIGTEYDEVEEGEAITGFIKYPTQFTLTNKNTFENPYYIIQDCHEILTTLPSNIGVILAKYEDNKYTVMETTQNTVNTSTSIGTRVDLLSSYIPCAATVELSGGKDVFDFTAQTVTPIVAPFSYGFSLYRLYGNVSSEIVGKNLNALSDVVAVKIGTYTQNDIGAEDTFTAGITDVLQPNTEYTYAITLFYIVDKNVISNEYILALGDYTTGTVVELDIKGDKNDLYVAKNTDKIVLSQNNSENLTLPDVSFNETTVENDTYYISNLIIQTDKDIDLDGSEAQELLHTVLGNLDVSEYAIIGKLDVSETNLGKDYANYLPTFNGTLKMRLDERDLNTAPDDLIIFDSVSMEYNGNARSIVARVNTDVPEYAAVADSATYLYTYYKNGRPIPSTNVKGVGTYVVVVEANVGSYSTVTKTANLTITPKELTYSGHVLEKVYDGTGDATLSTTEVEGIVGDDDVTVTFDAHYSQEVAGDGAIPCSVTATLSGEDSGNYTLDLSEQAFTGIIRKKQLTLADGAFTVEPGVAGMTELEVPIEVDQSKVIGIVGDDVVYVTGKVTYPRDVVGACVAVVSFEVKSSNETGTLADFINYEAPVNVDVATRILDVMSAVLTPVYGLGGGTKSIRVEFASPTFRFANHNIATEYNPTIEIVSYSIGETYRNLELFGNNGNFRQSPLEGDNVYVFDIKATSNATIQIDAVIRININGFVPIESNVTEIKIRPSYYGMMYLPYDYVDDNSVALFASSPSANPNSYVRVLEEYENMDDEIMNVFLSQQKIALRLEKVPLNQFVNLIIESSEEDWANAITRSNDNPEEYTFSQDGFGRYVIFTRKDWGTPQIWDKNGSSNQTGTFYVKEYTINNVEYNVLISKNRFSRGTECKLKFVE